MFKIGELSEITGVSVQAIRFYEKENLIKPIEVDRWTNYRYYDSTSIYRLAEITQLKNLGFSLNEIKNLDDKVIKNKIKESKINLEKLSKNIKQLSTIKSVKGELIMKTFINDERVIGKWQKIAVVSKKENFKKDIFEDDNIFDFNELYFLPNGEEYWVFSWTKGTLFINNKFELPYEIIDNNLFIGIVDAKSGKIDNYAIYKQIDNKKYKPEEIKITDNIDLPFINDNTVIGFWDTVDFVKKTNDFKEDKQYWDDELYLKRYTFEPDGSLIGSFGDDNNIVRLKWTKNLVINEDESTASEYQIKKINNSNYMFVEWKSGDYKFGGKINGYYVLKQNH